MGTEAPVSLADRVIRHYAKQEFAKVFNGDLGELLPGCQKQYVDEESVTPNYVVGSRTIVGMTVYHYSKMDAIKEINVGNQLKAVGNVNGLDEQNTSAVPATVAVGAMAISILDAVSAAHDYQNAKLFVWPAGAETQVFDIVDNDASDGANVVLHLARPVRNAIAAGTFTSIYKNIYGRVGGLVDIGTGLAAAVGVPQRLVTTGYYFWLPTWGLVSMVQGEPLDGVGGPGVVVSPGDGAAWKLATSVAAGNSWQRIGRMAAEQTAGIDCGIFLELDA
jgi:rhodanese-related sulfurtransferase